MLRNDTTYQKPLYLCIVKVENRGANRVLLIHVTTSNFIIMKYNFNVESVNAISASVNKFEGLKEANKEVKSLSGAIRICTAQKFWEAGYNKAFAQFGFSERKSLSLKSFFDFLHPDFVETGTDKQGNKYTAVRIWAVRTKTTGAGADRKPVLNKQGEPIKEAYLKTVKAFTPVLLLKVLAQSAEAKK